jgi:hypothetical protein
VVSRSWAIARLVRRLPRAQVCVPDPTRGECKAYHAVCRRALSPEQNRTLLDDHRVSVWSVRHVQEPVFGDRIRSYWLSLSHDRADRMEAATKLYMWKPEIVNTALHRS